jgi:hypothetical protein
MQFENNLRSYCVTLVDYMKMVNEPEDDAMATTAAEAHSPVLRSSGRLSASHTARAHELVQSFNR